MHGIKLYWILVSNSLVPLRVSVWAVALSDVHILSLLQGIATPFFNFFSIWHSAQFEAVVLLILPVFPKTPVLAPNGR